MPKKRTSFAPRVINPVKITDALILSAAGNCSGMPPQFLIGASPLATLAAVNPAVPYSCRASWKGWPFIEVRCSLIDSFMPSGSASSGVASPTARIALTRLEPITAPRPLRPAARPLSLMMQESRSQRSPAGPMLALRDFLP